MDDLSKPADDDTPSMPQDPGRKLAETLVFYLLKDMKDDERRSSAIMECARKLLTDNSVTLASVRKGDFGELAKEAAEKYPFDEQGRPLGGTMMGVN